MSEPTDEQRDYLEAQLAEYGKYVANQNITFNGALAYRAGQPVPVSNVEKHDYLTLGLVREAGTPAPEPEAPAPAPQGDPIELSPADEPDLNLHDHEDEAQSGDHGSEA